MVTAFVALAFAVSNPAAVDIEGAAVVVVVVAVQSLVAPRFFRVSLGSACHREDDLERGGRRARRRVTG